jgi:streptomycin 6-kinase
MSGSLSNRHLLVWHLTPDGAPIETNTSWLLPVWHRSGSAMLKVFKPHSDEQNGAEVLRYFDGSGAVRLIEADEFGLLLERADSAPSLVSLALSGGDDAASEILLTTVKQLHSPHDKPHPNNLILLRDWFESLFAHEAELPILQRCASAARDLLIEPRDEIVLHGDLHHENVLGSPRGWLAIDPKGLFGERTYEVANLFGNPVPHGEIVHHPGRMRRLATLCADHLALDIERVLGFALAHAGLAASWSMTEGCDPSYRLRCAEILGQLVA